MPEKLLEFGLAGAVMGAVMMIVVSPMVKSMTEELRASRTERQTLCSLHQAFHSKINEVLVGLAASMESLVRRANGG